MGHCWSASSANSNTKINKFGGNAAFKPSLAGGVIKPQSVLKKPSIEKKLPPWQERWLGETPNSSVDNHSDSSGLDLIQMKDVPKLFISAVKPQANMFRKWHSTEQLLDNSLSNLNNRCNSTLSVRTVFEPTLSNELAQQKEIAARRDKTDQIKYKTVAQFLREDLPVRKLTNGGTTTTGMPKNVSFNDLVIQITYAEREKQRSKTSPIPTEYILSE